MRHIQGCLSWFGSCSHLFCTAVCALGWILQSHRCVQCSYTMVLAHSTASHDSATCREHSVPPTALTPNTHVEQHHLSWASISTLCPPPRRNWEPLMLLSSGHPLANCSIHLKHQTPTTKCRRTGQRERRGLRRCDFPQGMQCSLKCLMLTIIKVLVLGSGDNLFPSLEVILPFCYKNTVLPTPRIRCLSWLSPVIRHH